MRVFSMELRNQRRSALTWTLVIAGFVFAMLAFFPSMQTESMQALAGAKIEGVDPTLLAALGLSSISDFTVVTHYFGYVLQYVTLVMMVFVTLQAAGLLVKEETDGTIEYLYAKPVSRGGIYRQKLFAHLFWMVLLVAFAAGAALGGYLLFAGATLDAALRDIALFFPPILFVGLIFTGVGVLLSSLIKSSKAAAGVAIGVVFGSFVLGAVSLAVRPLSFLSYLSPMDWIKPQRLLAEGVQREEWIIGAAIIAICLTAAGILYRKRDLLV